MLSIRERRVTDLALHTICAASHILLVVRMLSIRKRRAQELALIQV